MSETELVTDLSAFSSDGDADALGAGPRRTSRRRDLLALDCAPDGRHHVTPLLGVRLDGALYFCAGRNEHKAHNLAQNRRT